MNEPSPVPLPVLEGSGYQALFNAAPAAYVVVQADAPDFHIAEVNQAYLNATMTNREDLIGQPLFDAFPENPADRGATAVRNIRASLERVIASRASETLPVQQYDLRGPDGEFQEHHWGLTSIPLFDGTGRLTHILHAVEDVTALTRATRARRDAEEERTRLVALETAASRRAAMAESRLRRVYDQAPVAMAVMRGPEHVFDFANPRYLDLVGHRAIVGLSIREAFPELAGQGIYERLDEVFATGRPYLGRELGVQLLRHGSEPGTVIFNFVYEPLVDESGAVEGIAVVASDVTELVQGREAARLLAAERDADRSQLITVLEQSPLAITIADAASGRILFANAKVTQILGVQASSIAEQSGEWRGLREDGTVLGPGEWPLERAIRDGETISNEVLQVEHPDGRRRDLSVNAAPVRDASGAVIAGVVLFWDMTAERRTERELHDAQRLQAVGTLAGGVAHEVNNQITAVLGFGEFVLGALGPTHEQAPDMRQVLQAANRVARISQQLLAFSRQQITQPRALDLHDVVAGLAPVLQQLLGNDKTLTISSSRGAPPVHADPAQVEQVLINLVANARDATDTGARITIAVEPVEIGRGPDGPARGPVPPGRYVRLSVDDTGQGMAPDTLARIFEPFFTTKAIGEGTGLGLSMVYGIVRQNGGYIWARSEVGRGTSMEVYWPQVAPATIGAGTRNGGGPARLSGPHLGPGRTVLVVEDEPSVRDLAVRTLELEGFTVLAADHGQAALDLVREGAAPDIVVTDLIMPHLNGRQLRDKLAELRPDLPVLFISGYSGDDVVLRRLLPSDAPFLQKPFTPDALARAVSSVMRAGATSGDQ